MALKIYNTLNRQKELFQPDTPGEVKIYNCGPTTYDYFHIGNARNFVIFDVIRRYLRLSGYKVKFVQNLTDVDDKIIQRAQEENTTPQAIAEKYTKVYFEDADALGILRADVHPKATEHIPDMIAFIQDLIKKGAAYRTSEGVYFNILKSQDYGKLSKQRLEDLIIGIRVEVDQNKKSPADFALWKKAKPGEPSWQSPWGEGRPGWHIECSTMSTKYLGDTLDIHGGGSDLIFPHHENEIAQSETRTGKPFANYWIHNGYLNIAGEKMSKSLGNIVLIRDLLKIHSAAAVRFFLLSAHYRSPLDFTDKSLEQAEQGLKELHHTIDRLANLSQANAGGQREDDIITPGKRISRRVQMVEEKFRAAMDDDFNTAVALGCLFDLANEIKLSLGRTIDNETFAAIQQAKQEFEKIMDVLGLMPVKGTDIPYEVRELVQEREQARKNQDWKAADRLRTEISKMGYAVDDTPNGPLIMKI